MNLRIISGGQTGADMGGLLGARDAGVPTGGTAPKGWLTESGPRPELADFGLVEHFASGYPPRTRANVADSELTLWFGDADSRGGKLTERLCLEMGRLMACNPDVKQLRKLLGLGYAVVNVAGNRESVSPGMERHVRTLLCDALLTYTPF